MCALSNNVKDWSLFPQTLISNQYIPSVIADSMALNRGTTDFLLYVIARVVAPAIFDELSLQS